MSEFNGDPQFTTGGVYSDLDSAGYGPYQGQRGVARKKEPPRARPRRATVAARRGEDETGKKNALGEKAKNPRQLPNPKERKKRQLGPVGRARTGITRRPKGRKRTAAAGGSPRHLRGPSVKTRRKT